MTKQGGETEVKCIVSNVGTSLGVMSEGDVKNLPADEAKFLIGRKQVEATKKRAKK